jgi:hypothetical protein
MLKKVIAIITIISAIILAVLLNATAPATAGPFGILALFICAYLFLLGLMTYVLAVVSRLIARLSIVFTVKRPIAALPFRRAYYFSTIVAAAPIMLIGLQSVGAVTIYEFLLVLLFVVIGCLYIAKRIR